MPIAVEQVRPGEQVDVLVTDGAATRLKSELGAYAQRLQGPIARERGDSVSVSVMISREYGNVSLESSRLTLFLSRSEVTGVRRRVWSRPRTVLASLGAVALFGVVVGTVIQAGDPNGTPDDPLPQPPTPTRFGVRFSFR